MNNSKLYRRLQIISDLEQRWNQWEELNDYYEGLNALYDFVVLDLEYSRKIKHNENPRSS